MLKGPLVMLMVRTPSESQPASQAEQVISVLHMSWSLSSQPELFYWMITGWHWMAKLHQSFMWRAEAWKVGLDMHHGASPPGTFSSITVSVT